jgi:hypothetical protein
MEQKGGPGRSGHPIIGVKVLMWRSGETVLARSVWRERVCFAGSVIVVEESAQRTLLFTPMGTPVMHTPIDYRAGTIGEPQLRTWHTTHNLRFLEPDSGYCISALYDGNGGQFLCWYIDLIEPFRRVRDGVVLWDLALDIVVAPDLSWTMKDEDHFDLIQKHGWITPRRAAQVRRDAQQAIKRIERRQPPFNENWHNWRPSSAWSVPALPAGWDIVPGD